MDTTGRDITHPGLMPIMAAQSITVLDTIAGERLLTGKGKGPVHPGLFLTRDVHSLWGKPNGPAGAARARVTQISRPEPVGRH